MRTSRIKRALHIGAATIAMTLAAAEAAAQQEPTEAAVPTSAGTEPPTEVGGGVQEIVVTAQKRAENLQDVPIAITAIGSQQLEARGITGLATLQTSPPPACSHSPSRAIRLCSSSTCGAW